MVERHIVDIAQGNHLCARWCLRICKNKLEEELQELIITAQGKDIEFGHGLRDYLKQN